MNEKIKTYQQSLVVILIVICMEAIMAGGVRYVKKLRHDLQVDAVRQLLTLPNEKDATYLVTCLDDDWVCSTFFDDIRQLDEDDWNAYRSLSGFGVRDSYTGTYSGIPRFGYYGTFTFASGHRRVIQKSYDRSKVAESFALSFYNGQGRSYVVNRQGDSLLRPTGASDGDNIFDMLVEKHGRPEDADRLREALSAG